MNDNYDGGRPAFPDSSPGSYGTGMTLRDYFAAQALVGFVASPLRTTDAAGIIAVGAYKLADAMLVERAKAAT